MSVKIRAGFPENQRGVAAQLYWEAFRQKLHKVMGPDKVALDFLTSVMQPNHAIGAVDDTGRLLGLAGFKTIDGAMVGGELSNMQSVYGVFGGLWRGLILSLLERDLEPGVLLMDGICVAPEARGQGLGTRLLHAIKIEAEDRAAHSVRLDVIDNNPRARALYLRQGFRTVSRERTGPLRLLFGFSSAVRMEYAVSQKNPSRRNAAN